jgi:deazaflavin-dependent oxidoreductase (nitroreductase family)
MAGGAVEHWVQKHAVNPVARLSVRLGLAPRHFALLETKGRKTGRLRQTPVGGAMLGSTFWVVAVHGSDSAYVKNLTAEPAVRVKMRRSWYSGRAAVVPDDDPLARHHQIVAANGWVGRADSVFFRASATTPLSVRVDLD